MSLILCDVYCTVGWEEIALYRVFSVILFSERYGTGCTVGWVLCQYDSVVIDSEV